MSENATPEADGVNVDGNPYWAREEWDVFAVADGQDPEMEAHVVIDDGVSAVRIEPSDIESLVRCLRAAAQVAGG